MVSINFFFSSSFACQNLPDFQSLPPAPEVSRSFQISWLPSAGSKLQVDLSGPNAVKLFVMSNFRYTYCKPWPYFDAIFIHYFKAHSHLLKQSSDSEGDCQCRYWNFSISLQQRNCLQHTAASNAASVDEFAPSILNCKDRFALLPIRL